MKQLIIILLLSIIGASHQSMGQNPNLVPNPGFESKSCCPTWFNQLTTEITCLNDWDVRKAGCGLVGSYVSGTADYHNTCGLSPVTPHGGDGYAGLIASTPGAQGGYREYLIVQLDQKMEIGESYYVEFYVQAGSYTPGNSGVFHTDPNLVVGSNRIGALFTTSRPSGCNGWLIPDHPQVQHDFNVVIMPEDGWIRVSGNMVADQKYDWLTIGSFFSENDTWYVGNTNADPHFFVDDVLVTKGCRNLCSSTDGPMNVTATNFHHPNQPFCITGLARASRMKLDIYNQLGGTIMRTITINNPSDKVCWDGETGQGNEAIASLSGYPYLLELTNDCGTTVVSGEIIKNIPGNTLPSPFFNYQPVSKPPDPCCVSDMLIQNEILIQDQTLGPLEYAVNNTITAGPQITIPAGNEVIFQAVDEIVLRSEGFHVQDGANFHAFLTPCTKSLILPDIPDPKPPKLHSTFDDGKVTISPNPNNGQFQVSVFSESTSDVLIEVVDLLGKEVYQHQSLRGKQVEATLKTDQPPGIYFVRITREGQLLVKKIIIQ